MYLQRHIEVASEAMKQCIGVCNRYRKKSTFSESLGKIVKRTNYDSYTPGMLDVQSHCRCEINLPLFSEEVHAELCYAESLLLKSILTFIEDETLVSFIRAGLKIRSCLASYK